MAPAWECETEVVSQVIRILESALACSTFPEGLQLQDREKQFARKFLNILVAQNGSFNSLGDDGISLQTTSTDSILNTTTGTISLSAGAGEVHTNVNPKHRLKHLELIKVGVLIFVISIIMLTTCRMIFQLFVRFRPEKPQD